MAGKYNAADVVDAVRGMRVCVNTLDNVRTQLTKIKPVYEGAGPAHLRTIDLDKLDSDMSKFTNWLADVLTTVESSLEYKDITRRVRGDRSDHHG